MSESCDTVLIVQCRLSSSRLPGKALLPLGNKTVLDWTLSAMKKVRADAYYVATDAESYDALLPVASRNGFSVFKGPLEDVLERFCQLIEKTGAKTVIRATADNPFLFYEAAQALVDEYEKRRASNPVDYITWTGLPHGSGVEVFSAESLLKAKPETSDAYDHEHVAPALYKHTDRFSALFLPAPEAWNRPDLRTTIDTKTDYRRACAIVRAVSASVSADAAANAGGASAEPFTCKQIIAACEDASVSHPVLCVPCVKKGRGTGHLRRCLSIAVSAGADVYIPEDADLDKKNELLAASRLEGLCDWQIVTELPQKNDYALILTDAFSLNRDLALKLASVAPLAAIDEGSLNTDVCDYLLDIIPSYGITRPANVADPSFVTLPKNRRSAPKITAFEQIKNILVTVGGEDPADLVVPAATAFAGVGKNITAIIPSDKSIDESLLRVPESVREKVTFIPPVHNLREKLYEYDVVVTHYGFTAFEAVAAGCGVVLLGTTALHVQLAQRYGFACIPANDIGEASAQNALYDVEALYPDSPFTREGAGRRELGAFVQHLAQGRRFFCPVCGDTAQNSPVPAHVGDAVVSRIPSRTFRRCSSCGMLYMSWTQDADAKRYDEAYFFENYKKQYGKTYLDDFTAIKSQCVRRTSVIDQLYRSAHKAVTPTVLDVGCAFGPYLDAANDAGWQVFGTDVSEEAVQYVQNTLHYPAVMARFPDLDPAAEYGVRQFDAVTMWYVIEHFQNLDAVLRGVARMVKKGGIFAFSTPSASGVSARFSPQKFFVQSPADHFTLWEPSRAASILRRYGFRVVKIVYTGHHPERFPKLAKSKAKPSSFRFSLFSALSHFFGLGDTFEVYCKKEKDISFDD
ncbi:MAG: methyltransferase domain-containing protein [Treponema sp.]|nr:methyltransferase domain-containing protein [Treponema sp.]